jgi:predicted nucleotidyltransferase
MTGTAGFPAAASGTVTKIWSEIPKMGMILPNMGRKKTTVAQPQAASLADALFSRTQQGVLGLLFGQPDRSFYASEVISLVGAGSGTVQRELARLQETGLISVQRIGSQKHYRANGESPLFEELRGIVLKTIGLAEPLRSALAPLASGIVAAFVYGSVAKRKDNAASDIDLLVISDELAYAELYSALEPLQGRLGRSVNPTLYTLKELAKRRKAGSAFVQRVLDQPKLWIIGGERDLAT